MDSGEAQVGTVAAAGMVALKVERAVEEVAGGGGMGERGGGGGVGGGGVGFHPRAALNAMWGWPVPVQKKAHGPLPHL